MKKSILIVALLLSGVLFTSSSTATYVYVCMGESSVCYHKEKKCKGLTNCSKEVKKITQEEAEKMKRRPCKICYK